MEKRVRELQTITFDTGTSSVTTELDAIDLSGVQALILILNLTKADTGAGDILDIKFQETGDRVTWNTRARFPNFIGTLSPSATAPETYRMTINTRQDLSVGEEAYEPDGSAGATALTADQVIHGPLLSPVRSSTGKATAHRVVFTVTNATAADFEGIFSICAEVFI